MVSKNHERSLLKTLLTLKMLSRKSQKKISRELNKNQKLFAQAASHVANAKQRVLDTRPRRGKKVVNLSVPRSRFTSSGQQRFIKAPTGSDYVKALQDPFFAPAPKLGFMTFVPTAKHTTWLERGQNIPATATVAAVRVVPCVSSCLTLYTGTSGNTALSALTSTQYNTTNQTTISSFAQNSRVINWAVRAKIRASATSLPGTLGCMYISDETSQNIDTLTINNLVSLGAFRPCTATSAGQIGGEVQYRPSDVSDFEFNFLFANQAAPSTTTALPQMMFIATGWTAAQWDMEITIIGHLECLPGADAAGESDAEPDMVDSGVTIDALSSLIMQAGEPVVTSLEALQKLDEADSNIRRIRYGHSIAGMLNNFASGTSSNSVLPAAIPRGGEIYSTGGFGQRQLRQIIQELKDEIVDLRMQINQNLPSTLQVDQFKDEISDYEEEKKVSDEENKKLENAQVVLSRSMFNTLIGK